MHLLRLTMAGLMIRIEISRKTTVSRYATYEDAPVVTSLFLDLHPHNQTFFLLPLTAARHLKILPILHRPWSLHVVNDMLRMSKQICQLCSKPSWSSPDIVNRLPEGSHRAWTQAVCQPRCSLVPYPLSPRSDPVRRPSHSRIRLFLQSSVSDIIVLLFLCSGS